MLLVYFAQNRFYDAANHRFTQEDPVRDGHNWYAYCEDNRNINVDPWRLRNVVIVIGADKASNNNAFKNNADAFEDDNSNDTIKRIYAWNYSSQEALLSAIGLAYGRKGIDALIVESHATTTSLIVTSSYSITRGADWNDVAFNYNANIRFTGCNADGNNGVAEARSIASWVAFKTDSTVWAYTNNTSQKTIDGKTYQKPVRMTWGQKVVESYTKFTPTYGPLPW